MFCVCWIRSLNRCEDSRKPFAVCHNRRIGRHRAFAGIATRGKSGMGWSYGFKLHPIVKGQGDLLAVHLTPANIGNRKPVPPMTIRNVFGG